MRKLTILRRKSFVGSLVTLKVYIEDHISGELTINGVPCRKLGNIKNGKEAVFDIDNTEAKVFVIADKISKNYCNDSYTVPAGDDDVSVSGVCMFNPASGNAFRFDGVTDEATLKERKKGTRIGIIVLIVALVLGFGVGLLIGFTSEVRESPKEYNVYNMSITLTDKFKSDSSVSGFDACYASNKVIVFFLRENLSNIPGYEHLTVDEYGEIVIEVNDIDASKISHSDDLTYFEYNNDSDYHYSAFLYKDGETFWMIQFCTNQNDTAKYQDRIFEWAASVKFS